jgi:hypothetical protein
MSGGGVLLTVSGWAVASDPDATTGSPTATIVARAFDPTASPFVVTTSAGPGVEIDLSLLRLEGDCDLRFFRFAVPFDDVSLCD